ncbi:hypothetical protein MN608_10346 [Microdochium nivale]|nr:hypothetical protein MN608_10346 [Microdochium nivale]
MSSVLHESARHDWVAAKTRPLSRTQPGLDAGRAQPFPALLSHANFNVRHFPLLSRIVSSALDSFSTWPCCAAGNCPPNVPEQTSNHGNVYIKPSLANNQVVQDKYSSRL